MATVAAAPHLPQSRSTRLLRKRILIYTGLTLYAVLAGLPVYWMLVTTFKADRDLYNLQNFPLWFNQAATLDHLNLLFNKTGFTHWLVNTLIVAVAVVAITLAVALFACTTEKLVFRVPFNPPPAAAGQPRRAPAVLALR